MDMNTLKDLITNSFNFVDITDEEKSKMIDELADIAIERTVIRAIEKMSTDEVDAFENEMGDIPDPKKVFGYLETAVPSFYDMLTEEVFRLVDLARDEAKV